MAGTISLVASVKVDHRDEGYETATDGSGQQKFLQTDPGGGNPGAVDITDVEEAINFGELTDPGIVRMQNLSDTFDVLYGPENGGVMITMGVLRRRITGNNPFAGGIGLWEVAENVTLRMVIDPTGAGSGSASGGIARVEIKAQER